MVITIFRQSGSQVKLPGAVVGKTCGQVCSYWLGMVSSSKKKYRSWYSFSPARARWAHSCSSEVWFITKSRQTLIPFWWQALVRALKSSMVPSSGWMVRKSATA